MMGNHNPAYKHGKTYNNRCKDCNIQIVSPSAKRCSKCYHKYIKDFNILKNRKITWGKKVSQTMLKRKTTSGKNNPMYGKVTHSKYNKYKNIWFHSSWEIAYAKYLDKLGIKWQYEAKTFDLGNTTYTPDFYLPETNKYIEIKGYWRPDAKKKVKEFKKIYKNIKFEVINKQKLEEKEIL